MTRPALHRPVDRAALGALGICALVLLRAGSCAETRRPYPPPTADQLVQALVKRTAALHTLRAETRMTHKTEKESIKATVRLMAAQGGKVSYDYLAELSAKSKEVSGYDILEVMGQVA